MSRFVLAAALLASFLPSPVARAQPAALTGTFITYMNIGPEGVMLANGTTGEDCSVTGFCMGGGFCDPSTGMCTGGLSMAYREDVGALRTCDAFYPGAPVETFTVEVGMAGGPRRLTNQFGSGVFVGTRPPEVLGREIHWSGAWREGTAALSIDQIHAYEADERVVRVSVEITNTGTTTFDGIYYLRNADPDFGSCNLGGSTSTDNDVRRQPPFDTSALVTSGSGTMMVPGSYYVLGIGATDDRARAHAGGFSNTDASGEWAMPADPEGASGDIGQDLVFYEPGSFGPGASVRFEFMYVWGTTVAEVEMRFDEGGTPTSPCGALPDGTRCDVRGRPGTCRATRCCTGCWNGMRCVAGSGTACGIGGALCVSCADGDLCTSDVCTAGVCGNPDAPRGTSCDDGLYCTETDTCDGTGLCSGMGDTCDDSRSCTIDTCDESTNVCSNVMGRGCIIGGECVGEGLASSAYPCLYCDPDRSTTDWTRRDAGTTCSSARCEAGFLHAAGACDGAGFCVAPRSMRCPTGACADALLCETPCTASSCGAGSRCDTTTRRCVPLVAMGGTCTADPECASGTCADGRCCSRACDGRCEACNISGQEGTCAPISDGSDPSAECGTGRVCDGMGACRGNRDAPVASDAGVDGGARDVGTAGMDAGADGGGGADAGAPTSRGSCDCRVARASHGPHAWWSWVLTALLVLRRWR